MTNIILIFSLVMPCSMQAVCTVCCLILSGHFVVNLMEALICVTYFIFRQLGCLSVLIKTHRHKYRQYQFPLRKGNTLNVIYRNHPELYRLYVITIYTHITNCHWEASSEISTVSLWHFRQTDLHNTLYNGINLTKERQNQAGGYVQSHWMYCKCRKRKRKYIGSFFFL